MARLLASKECYVCVEKIGLSGIGKRGTLAAAKALSEEKLLENRTAYLDLMELLLSRMNGDMQRFVRICGTSLSPKARDLLEERVSEGGTRSSIAASSAAGENTRRTSKVRSSPSRAAPSPKKPNASPMKASGKVPQKAYDDNAGFSSSFGDELPALGLRDSLSRTATSPSKVSQGIRRSNSAIDVESASNILSSLLDAEEMLEGSGGVRKNTDVEAAPSTVQEPALSRTATKIFSSSGSIQSSTSNEQSDVQSTTSSDLGAAASLRARLLKIREKNKEGSADEIGASSSSVSTTNSNLLRESQNKPTNFEPPTKESISSPSRTLQVEKSGENHAFVLQNSREHLDKFLETLANLIATDTPLREDDADIFATTDALKTIHAAVSGQAGLAVNLTPDEVTRLRDEINDRANEVVAALTR
jgi:cytoskeleton-associated protein 5